MKKTLVYSTIAVILGLLVTLVPLIAIIGFTAKNHYEIVPFTNSLSEQMRKLERSSQNLSAPNSTGELQILAISFVIAIVAYMLVKRRRPNRDYIDIRYPY